MKMTRNVLVVNFILFLAACGGHASNGSDTETGADSGDGTSFEWRTAEPASVGMDGPLLEDAATYIEAENLAMNSMIVVKEGKIVFERYFGDDNTDTLYNIESSTKSITAILVGIAIDEGLLNGVQTKVLDFFGNPSVENPSDEKNEITVADLLTMRSGLGYDNTTESFQDEEDTISFILGHEMGNAPGTTWVYSSADTQLLGEMIAEASGMSLRAYAEEKLFDKLGMSPGEWLTDKGGMQVAGYGLTLTARDMARFGLFMVNNGKWNNEQLVSEAWIDAVLTLRAETPWSRGDFGYSFWIKRFGGYCAGGRYGQQINFFPDENLVVVYTASLPLESADAILDTITQAFVLGTIDPPQAAAEDAGVEDDCGSLASEWISSEDIVPHGWGVFTYGDAVSTRCLHSVEDGRMCLRGYAANAGNNYENWGSGMAVRLAETDEDGNVVNPFDAAALDIHGVRFTLSGAESLPYGIRAGVTMVNQGELPYEYNGFIVGGGPSGDIKRNGEVTMAFDDLAQPIWTTLTTDTPLDTSELHSLRFQIVTQPGNGYLYDFCISDLVWLDENMTPKP